MRKSSFLKALATYNFNERNLRRLLHAGKLDRIFIGSRGR